jgi:CheY-like chemotaxis protein
MGVGGRTVLLVDDEAAIREATAMVLRDEGYIVAEACDGRQALNWLRGHPCEAGVVLLDIMMPVMDGADFLKARDREPGIAGIPVVLVTASKEQGERLLDQHRVQDLLDKPFSLGRLLGAIVASGTPSASPVT